MQSVHITEAGGKVCNLMHTLQNLLEMAGYFLAKVQHYSAITSTIDELCHGILSVLLIFLLLRVCTSRSNI